MLESNSNTTTSTTHSNVKRNNKENQTISDSTMTMPSLSINQNNNLVNSVIQQTNQQSVIQSAGSTAGTQSVQLSKSIILFNKINQNSVIQSIVQNTENEILQNNRMEQTDNDNSNVVVCNTADDESKRRREMLNRRPSYRKILNEISSADTVGILDSVQNNTEQRTNENQSQSSSTSTTSSQHIVVSNSDAVLSLSQSTQPTVNLSTSNTTSVTNSHTDQNNNDTIPLQVGPYLKMIPTTTMQLASDQDLLPASVQLTNHTNTPSHQQVNHHGIVQYANQEPQFFISDPLHWSPYRVNSSDFPTAYQLRDPSASPIMINSNNVSNASSFQSTASNSNNNNAQHRGEDEQDKKRQLRLQKNREAAKECRRKKKEYIKCLEDRVSILAQQNKTLIEELKTLKKLYCQQNE